MKKVLLFTAALISLTQFAAATTTMEGDTTNFFIYRKLSPYQINVSVIARGVSIGDEIEYADEITLGRSIVNRTSFNDSIKI